MVEILCIECKRNKSENDVLPLAIILNWYSSFREGYVYCSSYFNIIDMPCRPFNAIYIHVTMKRSRFLVHYFAQREK